VLHEKARLGILVALLNRPDGVLFAELRALCELTDGNLSRHLAVLQEAGVVEIWKGQDGARTRTLARLSRPGRDQLLAYLAELERVLRDARAAADQGEARRRSPGAGWSPA
jgi:DNA-binding transcriptional ArsR family regulator